MSMQWWKHTGGIDATQPGQGSRALRSGFSGKGGKALRDWNGALRESFGGDKKGVRVRMERLVGSRIRCLRKTG